MSDNVIVLKNIWKIFGDKSIQAMDAITNHDLSKQDVLAQFDCVVGVADCSLSVHRGEIFCIMGLSGCGKSTIVRHLNRLIEPTSGSVTVLEKDILALNATELRQMRTRHIGMAFQHVALLPHRTVRDNVAFPLQIQKMPKFARWEISQKYVDLVDLTGYEDRFPSELSGGMQQRVGLARALASDPEVLLMDEPFSALDPLIRRQLQDKFISLSTKLQKTAVFITHDLDEAVRIGNRIAIMKDGRIIQMDTPKEILNNPVNDYIRSFIEGTSMPEREDFRNDRV